MRFARVLRSRILLAALALLLALSLAPLPAVRAGPGAAATTPAEGQPSAERLRDLLFQLEHELHGLQADLMALQARLTELEEGGGRATR